MPRRVVTPPSNRKVPHNEHSAAASTSSSPAKSQEDQSSRPSSPFPAISLRRTRFSSVPLVHIKHADVEEISFPASVELPRRHVTFYSDVDSDSSLSGGGLCSMSDTMESFKELGSAPQSCVRIKHLTRNSDGSSRFPKLDECAHFHYDNVELGPVTVVLCDADEGRVENAKGTTTNSSGGPQDFCVQVSSNGKSWQIRRSLDNFQMLDRQLHRCVYDRKFSLLKEIDTQEEEDAALRNMLTHYLDRFSQLAGSLINCGPVLNWLELDNRGNRLIVTDEAAINTPAIAAAYVIKRYASQATDEISLEVGDIISVIDMPPPEESSWWRGKKGFQVGFFPCECVEIIGDKLPQSIKIPKAPAKPVLRKHGKLIAFFRSFLLTRPSRRKLKQSGILKERVFGCDLGEHLMNTGRDIPLVLKCCTEFIEQYGIVDGIYRLSGVTSNIQKLRIAFDEDRVPNLLDEAILQDIHCVASLLKMYFRELPNPLLTFHLYDKFVSAVQAEESLRLLKLRDVVQQLPPPHYRSLEYLMRHLSKVAAHGFQTGMTPKNVAIVWAPNLLRSRDIENGGVGALHVVGVQAILTEYLIRYTDIIFNEKMPIFPSPKLIEVETPKKTRPKSLAISTPTKLLSLEEARSRALTSNLPVEQQKFIDVGGGEENLPIKYHTIIELPSRRRSMGKGKKSPSGWKSLFSRGWHTTSGRRKNRHLRGEGGERPKIGSPIFCGHSSLVLKDKAITESDVLHTNTKRLRTVKSAEALFPFTSSLLLQTQECTMQENFVSNTQDYEFNSLPPESCSNTCHRHIRSSSHDSYFVISSEHHNNSEVPMEITAVTSNVLGKEAQKNIELSDSGSETNTGDRFSKDSPARQSKSAQKQKLVSFETEASSPKLQKLSLKRLYHTLSSPPLVKKESAKREKTVGDTSILASHTDHTMFERGTNRHSLNLQSNKIQLEFVQNSVPLKSQEAYQSNGKEVLNNNVPGDLDMVAVEVHPIKTCSSTSNGDMLEEKEMSFADDLEDPVNFSMEATLSDSASLSQLLSFDSKEQNLCNPESLDHRSGYSWAPQDSSLATPESPTGDNVSDLPSSDSSENSGSNCDVNKQTAASDSFIAEVQSRHLANNIDCKANSNSTNNASVMKDAVADAHSSIDKNVPLSSSSENFPINFDMTINNVSKDFIDLSDVKNLSPADSVPVAQTPSNKEFVDDLILSPPPNFGDKQNIEVDSPDRLDSFTDDLVSEIKLTAKCPSGRTMERSKTEVHEICPKFVSGIAVSGSFAQDLFRASHDSGESFHKKRSCSDKLSPISPNEDSKRKFESEIGRLIVRDRQMKMEMEQMKAERQRHSAGSSTLSDSDRGRSRSSKKFVDAVDFKKSPTKSSDSDKKKADCDDLLKSFRDDRKAIDSRQNLFSRYVRIDNKPSVKELLSKFEGHKDEDSNSSKFYTDSIFPLQKQSSGVFSNVQVINHNYPLTYSRSLGSNCNFVSDPKDNHSKENIFQTECVIRFPHPKTTNFQSQHRSKPDSKISVLNEEKENNSQIGAQCDPDESNSKTTLCSEEVLSTSPKQDLTSLLESVKAKACSGLSWMSQSMGSDTLSECLENNKDNKCANEETGSAFSTFKDAFNRANRALQMKNEFLQRGVPHFDGSDKTAESNYFSLDSGRCSRSPTECHRRHLPTRQRPKSVPPPTCRLSYASAKGPCAPVTTSSTKKTESHSNVPKTLNVGLTNGKESSTSSQSFGLPKKVKERAAIFERSLSFSGVVEKTPPSSHKAQTDSSNR